MGTLGRRTISIIMSVIMVLACFAGMTFSVGAETSGDYEYEVLDDGTVSILKYNGRATDIIIPSEIDGKKVTEIDSSAFTFEGCTELTSVTIPDGVKAIELFTFYGCSKLTSITIGKGVELIPDSFEGCDNLNEINVAEDNNNYKSVDGIVFSKDMTELWKYPTGRKGGYVIPDGVETIYSAFYYRRGLTDISIPDSVTTIAWDAFRGCSGLTNITIPRSVTGIYDYAFEECTGLTTITIPQSVTEIREGAFYGCPEIKSVTILNKDTLIGDFAFGHYYDSVSDSFKTTDGLTIYGYSGSTAEKYALRDGFSFSSLKPNSCEHANTELKNVKTATCTEDGYSGDKYCTVCGALVENGAAVKTTGHKFADGICTVCGETDPNFEPTEKPMETLTENPTEKPTETPTEKPTEPSTEIPNNKPTEPNTDNPNNNPTEKTTEPSTSAGEKLSFADNPGVKGNIDRSNKTVLIYPYSSAEISIAEFKSLFNSDIDVKSVGKSIVFSGMKFTFSGTDYMFILKGDTDGNGKITAADARIALRYAARLENIDDSILPAAEVDEDGRVTAQDARIILRYAAKLIGQMDGAEIMHIHSYSDATCTLPEMCSCGATAGSALGHQFSPATCTSPQICSRCGQTEGSALGHDYVNNKCSRCGKIDPDSLPVRLNELYLIDCSGNTYEYRNNLFTDSFGEVYDGAHCYLDALNEGSYSTHNLDRKYSKFTGSIVAMPDTSTACTYSIGIYVDGVLKYSKSNFSKITGKTDFSVDVKDGAVLTIKVCMDSGYGSLNMKVAIVNAQLEK